MNVSIFILFLQQLSDPTIWEDETKWKFVNYRHKKVSPIYRENESTKSSREEVNISYELKSFE